MLLVVTTERAHAAMQMMCTEVQQFSSSAVPRTSQWKLCLLLRTSRRHSATQPQRSMHLGEVKRNPALGCQSDACVRRQLLLVLSYVCMCDWFYDAYCDTGRWVNGASMTLRRTNGVACTLTLLHVSLVSKNFQPFGTMALWQHQNRKLWQKAKDSEILGR